MRNLMSIVADHPGALCFQYALALKSYTELSEHRPGVIAQALGISIEEVGLTLHRLAEAGVIHLRDRKWVPYPVELVIRRKSDEAVRIRSYWTRRLVDFILRTDQDPPSGGSIRNFLSASPAALQEILREISALFRRVEAIRAADREPQESIQLLWVQFFNVAHLTAEPAEPGGRSSARSGEGPLKR